MNDVLATRRFPHWMIREIYEQPSVFAATLHTLVDASGFRSETVAPWRTWLEKADEGIVIVASGSSRHAAMVAELQIEELSGIPVDVEYASEYIYRPQRALKHAAVIVVSQSGETADTLAALRKANAAGWPTLALTNDATSTMAREATNSFPLEAGKERAIPATKSFTAQLLSLYLLALLAGERRGTLAAAELTGRLGDLQRLPERLAGQLPGWEQSVRTIANSYQEARSFLFLGRGVHYPIAREGALKLKESAYIHAEGYPSGELKHGPNALVGEHTPLVFLATVDHADDASVERYGKSLKLMEDMHAQGADMVAIASAADPHVASLVRHVIRVDQTPEDLLPLCEVVPLQMLAYFMAVERGIDVDQPRNLSKAVLVE